MTTGHLKCEYLPIWVRNMQKCQTSKNDTFSTGPRSWKSSIFSTLWKLFENDEKHHYMTTGQLKCESLPIWVRNMQKCEASKMTLFRQVRGHENLQFFWLSVKPFKLMKNTTTWPQVTWNVNIYPFGWEICKNVKLAKMTLFRQVRGHENLQFFRLSGKPFKLMKNTTTWPQDTLNVNIYPFGWEICKIVKLAKMTLFRQVRGHENLQFFWLSGKPFKLMKNTTTWPQDTWNVNIYPFGWEICKNVKLAKMTLLRQFRGHENLQFFWLSGKPFKLMKNTNTWPQDT